MAYKNKEDQRRYQREWLRSRRQAWLISNGPCVICKATENLEVDHIDPNTKVDHRVWSWSEDRRSVELAKCRVLCEKCHQMKTLYDSGNSKKEHGTLNMYQHYKCRCEPCTKASSAVMAKYKQPKS